MDIEDILRLQRLGYKTDAFGQGVGAGNQFLQGFQAKQAADFQARQLDRNASNARATSQYAAENEADRAQLIASRALALAAASGGGASDPGVVSIMAKTAQEGAYRQQVALYEGESRAQAMELAADTRRYEGKVARNNGILNAAGSIFGATTTLMKGDAGNESLYKRFGMGAPTGPGTASWGLDLGID
jgi:hypothetical protein